MTDGILVVDKPSGPTSHDLVAQARRIFRTRRVGHAGTLDPLASGVMLLLFGEATKLSSYLTLQDKKYRAVVAFGRSTDSFDVLGSTTEEKELERGWLNSEKVERALARELEREAQMPPTFSAIKIDGERAHRLSRRGEEVQLSPRAVRLRAANVVGYDDSSLTVDLEVSKGYYVRSFANDLGAALHAPACLCGLRRTSSGCFSIAEAVAWPVDASQPLIAVAGAARRALPSATLGPEGKTKAMHGKLLEAADFLDSASKPAIADVHQAAAKSDCPVAWFFEDQLVALGRSEGELYKVVRGFAALQP